MDCILCGEKLENPEVLENHIKTHCYDKQYGIKPDPVAAAFAALTVRVDKLEQLVKVLEIVHSTPAEGYEQRVQKTAETAKRAKFN